MAVKRVPFVALAALPKVGPLEAAQVRGVASSEFRVPSSGFRVPSCKLRVPNGWDYSVSRGHDSMRLPCQDQSPGQTEITVIKGVLSQQHVCGIEILASLGPGVVSPLRFAFGAAQGVSGPRLLVGRSLGKISMPQTC